MKKISILFIAILLGGCSNIRLSTKTVDIAGMTERRSKVVVTNSTNLKAEVIALDERLGCLKPGNSFYDQLPVPHYSSPLPIVVRFYESSEMVGVAARTLHLRRGGISEWTIRRSDITWFGGNIEEKSRGLPRFNYKDGDVEFPFLALANTTAVQVVNVTPYNSLLKKDGRKVVVLVPGDFYFMSFQAWRRRAEVSLSATFYKEGGYINSSRPETVRIGGSPEAEQIIFK
ncbi:MAG: hypothetical protein ABEI53_01540 [Candidatus Magasanikbacteria bacterium]